MENNSAFIIVSTTVLFLSTKQTCRSSYVYCFYVKSIMASSNVQGSHWVEGFDWYGPSWFWIHWLPGSKILDSVILIKLWRRLLKHFSVKHISNNWQQQVIEVTITYYKSL